MTGVDILWFSGKLYDLPHLRQEVPEEGERVGEQRREDVGEEEARKAVGDATAR